MADSDNTTTLSFVTGGSLPARPANVLRPRPGEFELNAGESRNEPELQPTVLHDPALRLLSEWQTARYISTLLCRVQQRLESQILVNPGIQGLTAESPARVQDPTARSQDYAVAREAEVFAMTEALKLQDSIPEVAATSLIGVIAKLEMIVGADRDIGDPTDFPWPHLASVLRDLKSIAGGLTVGRRSRERTRSDVAKHWESAVKLVAALKEEAAAGHSGWFRGY